MAHYLTLSIAFFGLYTNALLLSNLKTTQEKNAKLSEFVIYVNAIIYFLQYNLHYSTSKSRTHHLFTSKQK